MKHLRWIVTIPLAVAIIVFSVSNRESVLVDPWPLGGPLFVPLYILVLGAAAGGLLAGSTMQWLTHAPARLQSRRKSGQIGKLEAELGKLKETPTGTPGRGGLPAAIPPLDTV